MAGIRACISPAAAAGHFQRLKSFGFPDQIGSTPRTLIQASDGGFYGTTQSGTAGGTVFRVNGDGSGYRVLHDFVEVQATPQGVVEARDSDGAFYRTAFRGGHMDDGTVFKVWPPELPILTGISLTAGKAHVSLEGAAGCQYQVLRSTNLSQWSVLGTTSMPPEGVCIHEDADPPPLRAFYRAVWLP